MATTINAYSVSLGMNASNFIDTSKLTRSEVSSLTREIRSLETPSEKASKSIDKFDKALAAGAITAQQHAEYVKRVGDKYEETTKKIDPASQAIVNFGKAWLSIEAVRQVGSFIKTQADEIDRLTNTAQKLGESVPNLQKFSYAMDVAAQLDATEAEQYLSKISKSVGEASLGATAMADKFSKLGLSVDKLRAMSPVEQFMATAKALSEVQNASERAALASDIFGRSGSELLPILNADTAQIERMMQSAEDLGLTISSIDAERIASANDQLGIVAGQFKIIGGLIAAEIAPALQSITTSLSQANGLMRPLVDMVGTMADGFAFSAAVNAQIFETYKNAFTKMPQGDFGSVFRFDVLDKFFDDREAALANVVTEAAKPIGIAVDSVIKSEATKNEPTPAPAMWDDFAEKQKFLQGKEMSILEKREEVLNKEAKLSAPTAMGVGSADAYKFFVERQTAAQQADANAKQKAEALARQQIDATRDVKQAVDNLAANIKRKR